MLSVVESQVLIHLVTDDDDIVLHGKLRDHAEIGPIQNRTGGIVRRIDQQRLGFGRERRRELRMIES